MTDRADQSCSIAALAQIAPAARAYISENAVMLAIKTRNPSAAIDINPRSIPSMSSMVRPLRTPTANTLREKRVAVANIRESGVSYFPFFPAQGGGACPNIPNPSRDSVRWKPHLPNSTANLWGD